MEVSLNPSEKGTKPPRRRTWNPLIKREKAVQGVHSVQSVQQLTLADGKSLTINFFCGWTAGWIPFQRILDPQGLSRW